MVKQNSPNMKKESKSNFLLFPKKKKGKRKCILSACLDSQEAKAANKDYSIFTHYLIKGLSDADGESIDKYGNVTTSQLGDYIYHKITNHEPQEERPKQIPIILFINILT